MSQTPANASGLATFKRSMISKRSGALCNWCGTPCHAGQDFAALGHDGKWFASCTACSVSVSAMILGVCKRIGAVQDTLTPEQTAGLSMHPSLLEAIDGKLDATETGLVLAHTVATWHTVEAIVAKPDVAVLEQERQILALRSVIDLIPAKNQSFARSLLAQWDTRRSLSDKQWPWVTKLAEMVKGDTQALSALPEADCGLYMVGDDICKVYTTQNGHKGMKRLDISTRTFNYVRGGMVTVREALGNGTARMLTGQEAAALGRQYGFCVVCALDLTDDISIAMGIGPVCAKNMGLRRITAAEAGDILRP